MRTARSLALLCVVVSSAACGGGSGGESEPRFGPSLVSGTYFRLELASGLAGPSTVGLVGLMTADGNGNGAFPVVIQNANGSIASLPGDGTFTYTVGSTGDVVLDGLEGRTDVDGDCVLLADLDPLELPAIMVALRREGAFSDASLAGTYHAGFMFEDATGWGQFVADGAGVASFNSLVQNLQGSLAISTPPIDATFSVEPDGSCLFSIDTLDFSGGLRAAGAYGLAMGDAAPLQDMGLVQPGLLAFVRHSAGTSDADFVGEYAVVGMGFDGMTARSITGSLTADGAGSLVSEFTQNDEGFIAVLPPTGGTAYTMGSSGGLTVTSEDNTYRGALSPDRRFGFLAGDLGAGNRLFLVFYRRL